MTERETGMEKENRLRMGTEILGEEMMKKDDRERGEGRGYGRKQGQSGCERRRQGRRRGGTRAEGDMQG